MGYVNSLSSKADFYFNAENYDEAIRAGKEKLLILEHILGKDSLEYAISEGELALYIANTGQYKESIILAQNALYKIEKIEGKESVLYAITAEKLSIYYSLLEDYDQALIYIQQAVNAFKETLGTKNDYYISSKAILATTYTKLHRIQDAIEIQKDCNEYYIIRGDSVKYAMGLHGLSLSYATSGDYSKAINYCEASSKLLLHHLGQGDLLYRETLKTLADYYVEIGDFDKVYNISTNHVQLCKQYSGENSHDYIRALSNQAFYYCKGGNYKKAIELEENVLSLQEKGMMHDSLDYAITLSNLATFNREMGFIDKAIALDEQSLCILNGYPATEAYRGVLSDLSSCYMLLGDFEKAIEFINTVLNTLQDRKGSEYYGYLSNLANCYYRMNQMPKAIDIYTTILHKQELLTGKNNLDFASTLENLASCYSRIESYRDAITTQNECGEIILSVLGEGNGKYAFSLLNLGFYYRCVGDDKKAIELQEKALNIFKNNSESGIRYIDVINQLIVGYRDNAPEYALRMAEEAYDLLKKNFSTITSTHIRLLQNMVYLYVTLGQFDNAKKICYTDFEEPDVHDYLMKNMTDYVSYLQTKSRLSYALQDYEEAVIIDKKVIETCKSIDNKACELSIINMLMCYLALNDTTNTIKTIKENDFIEETRNKILPNINSLTAMSRFSYWNKYSKLYTDFLPILAVASKDSTLICQAYDNSALFAKSLLLKNDMRISEIIRSSNDDSLQLKFKKYQDNLSYINNSLQDSITRDDLLKINIALEDEIRQRLLSLHLITDVYATWKDIQQRLEQVDVAIEFLSFQLENSFEGYIALVNKKNYPYPHLYTLFDKNEIIAAKDSPSILFNLIWNPLQEELEDAKNIFFSPAGELYNLNIEYLNDSIGQYLFDKYNIYRLSSTQELLHSYPSKSLQSAVLYGG
ncbi:MAG: tetratricopeptide repeat protein, partial [Bacteroidales bacterium]|nr:tetratricopeptide repeat protein [Bacteroidales bacterium]